MTRIPTSPDNLKKINTMFKAMENLLTNLYMRWQDEKEYEDIKEYGDVVKSKLHPDFIFVQMNKSPFSFKFRIRGFEQALYRVKLSGRSYEWERLE